MDSTCVGFTTILVGMPVEVQREDGDQMMHDTVVEDGTKEHKNRS